MACNGSSGKKKYAGYVERSINMSTICQVKHLKKTYGDRTIFEDFNLQIEENEMICIAGKSGSGKSTLLNMIGMFEEPDAGEILLFGKKRPKMNSKSGRILMKNRLFYLFQNFALVDNQTISYNLDIPLEGQKYSKKEKEKKKREALERVGLGHIDLRQKIYHLSGGEQQRVAIARGYLREFDILLADEPTGSLDEKNRDEILDMMRTMQQEGKTILIVSHDSKVMERADRVIRIS